MTAPETATATLWVSIVPMEPGHRFGFLWFVTDRRVEPGVRPSPYEAKGIAETRWGARRAARRACRLLQAAQPGEVWRYERLA